MFDFDDIDKDKLKKVILITIIIIFSVIGLFLIFPILFYIFVSLGILIPSIILYRIFKNEKYEKWYFKTEWYCG